MKFLSLVTNEWVKIFSRVRTWVFIALPILIVLGVAIYGKVTEDESVKAKWKQELTEQNKELKKEIAQAKKDKTPKMFRESLETEYKQNQYAIKHDISPYETTSWKFMKDFSPLSSLLGLFVIVVASDIVATEFAKGTVKMLLIRPYSRWKILLSKLLATLGFAFLLWIVLIVSTWLIGSVFYGFGGMDQPYLTNVDGVVQEKSISHYVLANMGLEFIEFTVLVALAFMISTLFYSSSVAIGVSMFVMFAGNILTTIFSGKSWAKYTLFPNMDLTQYLDEGMQLVKGMSLSFSLGMLAAYTAVFLVITFAVFQKRDVRS
ncbi:ABC transporter permease [Fictibacillus sp. KU28468]|uniref:ABC transporter permease n=1 Tax=Fictibacillus sp. KU28468 TaxID=2991053 RepID=UPI00223D9494|nr:ABC transporter permease [Fictibacillus sp. KU28468]UZJ79235.1 ABC transporter permease [Fictibacillus sp. KU28468]